MLSQRYIGQLACVLVLAFGWLVGGCQAIGTPLGSGQGQQTATPKVPGG